MRKAISDEQGGQKMMKGMAISRSDLGNCFQKYGVT